MASWRALHSLAIVVLWGALGLVMAFMVIPPAESGWWSYVVAGGILALYAWACVAYVRERRRKRRWA